jgi:DNA-binding IclR family transcriptional regulator
VTTLANVRPRPPVWPRSLVPLHRAKSVADYRTSRAAQNKAPVHSRSRAAQSNRAGVYRDAVAESEARRQPAHPISSVENALRLLVMLRDRTEIRVSEASVELGVARSTAHRLLAMLHSFGLVEQHSASRGYRVGPVLAEIGLSSLRHVDVRARLRPFLETLSRAVGETVHLIVLEGRTCRFVDSVEGSQALRTTARVGIAYPAHATSGGKALLARLDRSRLLELYPDERLPALNERSLTTREALFAQLDLVRQHGYAVNRGESEAGIAAVGMVQPTSSGAVGGALAVSAPELRLPEERVPEIVEALRRVTAEAQRQLP